MTKEKSKVKFKVKNLNLANGKLVHGHRSGGVKVLRLLRMLENEGSMRRWGNLRFGQNVFKFFSHVVQTHTKYGY